LNENGNIVLKIFDTFTSVTLKIIYILSLLFDETYIYKPLLSRLSDSEKYIICKKYNYDSSNKNIKKIINMIETIITNINSNTFINDIFVDIELPTEFKMIDKFSW